MNLSPLIIDSCVVPKNDTKALPIIKVIKASIKENDKSTLPPKHLVLLLEEQVLYILLTPFSLQN